MTDRPAHELRLAWITPILNVADVPASLRWFESLGWRRAFTYNIAGPIAGAADESAGGVAIFAKIDAGYGQMFLFKDGQGLRGGKPVVPRGGDDMGANWNHWWLYSAAEVDALHAAAVALGATIVAEPTDRTWGEREFSLAHPDGHVFRVSAPIGSVKPPTAPHPKDPNESGPADEGVEPTSGKPAGPAAQTPVSARPVGRYNIDVGANGEWRGVLTLGAEGQPAFINYGYAHASYSREQLGDVQWNEATRTLSFARNLYSNIVNQPYVLTFRADGTFAGTCGGAPAKGGPRGQSDEVPLPSGSYDITANQVHRGVLKIGGTDPAALVGTINLGGGDEPLRDLRWDAPNHTLMFLRPNSNQAYGLTFIDQGKAFHGGFGDPSNKWYDANGARR